MLKSRQVCSLWSKHSHLCKPSSLCFLSTSNQHHNDDDFLEKSIIPTMHFQRSMPRLPIPKLEDTVERYLNAQKPLLTTEEWMEAKDVADHFRDYEGRSLHSLLDELDYTKLGDSSYISEPWFDMYLRDRRSVVLNHNPFILTTDDPHTTDQLTRASKLIHNALRFKKSLDNSVLKPDVFHLNPKRSETKYFQRLAKYTPQDYSWYIAYLFNAYPLDMSQYKNLFNSTRVPWTEKDKLKSSPEGRQILVIRNGNMYLFDAIKPTGSLVSKDDIHKNLYEIMTKSNEKVAHPLPVMTSEHRDTWAAVRYYLEQDPTNAELLDKVDSALFGVFLDDEDCNDEFDATRMFLYGDDGSSRWFDKSFHMAISKNAKMAINFEHSWGDGVAVVRFLNETIEASAKDTFVPSGSADGETTVQELNFNIDEVSEKYIEGAQAVHIERTSGLKLSASRTEGFGSKDLKPNKLSPDSMIQLAFQMAYYRQNGKFVPTYESASTAGFKHGRTETLRPCTVETVACCEAFEPTHSAGPEEMMSLLKEASTKHSKLTKEALMGQGFDRHLFAMKKLAEDCERYVELFDDDAYKNLNSIILSTSTVFSPNIQMGGFAPVTPNGYGISYIVHEDWCGCNATSYPDSPDVNEFTELVSSSLRDIQAVVEGRNFKI